MSAAYESPVVMDDDRTRILHADVLRGLGLVGPESVDLVVTSPPYNLGIDYQVGGDDERDYNDYLMWVQEWAIALRGVATPLGRLCLNVPLDSTRGGHHPVFADVVSMVQSAGWRYQTSIVWDEGNISRRTAWGSWRSASAPYVVAPVEMIAVFSRGEWRRGHPIGSGPGEMTPAEYPSWVLGSWKFPGETPGNAGGHPAPFPLELPTRLIKLFSFRGDTVLDPFVGSGTTLIAARQTGRRGIGIDLNRGYCELAARRCSEAVP